MALQLDGTMELTSTPPVTSYPFTMSAWCYADGPSTGYYGTVMGISAGGTNEYWRIWRDVGNLRWSVSTVASGQVIITTTAAAVDAWHHVVFVETSNVSRVSYLNGTAGTPNTTDRAPASVDTLGVGNRGLVNQWTGRLAEVSVWDAALSAPEVAALAKGYSPAMIRPGSLVFYDDLIRNFLIDRTGNVTDLAWNDTAGAVGVHPRIIYPSRRKIFVPAAAAASAVFPPLMGKIIRAAPAY